MTCETCYFTSFSTAIQSYQDVKRVAIKGSRKKKKKKGGGGGGGGGGRERKNMLRLDTVVSNCFISRE